MSAKQEQPNKTGQTKETLKKRRDRFVELYLVYLDGQKAAIEVGVDAKNAKHTAYKWLQRPDIKVMLKTAAEERSLRVQINADEVLRECYRMAMSDVGEIFDEKNNLKAIKDIPIHVRRAVSGVKTKRILDGYDGDVPIYAEILEVKFWDKNPAVKNLMQHLGLLVDRVEHTGPDGGPLEFVYVGPHGPLPAAK